MIKQVALGLAETQTNKTSVAINKSPEINENSNQTAKADTWWQVDSDHQELLRESHLLRVKEELEKRDLDGK